MGDRRLEGRADGTGGTGARDPRALQDVRETYDRIASHFASTREYAWPEVESFVADTPASVELTESGLGLDLGCGNCRHAELLADVLERVVGIDLSRGLLETGHTRAVDRGFADALELVQGDAARLPLRENTVGLGVYVATLHHLPTRGDRIASLAELERVLTPGGRALVSAWSTEHSKFSEYDDGFDTTIEWTLPGGEPVDRFYHIYAPEEFDADLERSGLTIVRSEVSSGNCYAVVGSEIE